MGWGQDRWRPSRGRAYNRQWATRPQLVIGKRWLTRKMQETWIESKAWHQQQEQADRRQGQQTKTRPKQQPKMTTKVPDVPTDAEKIAYGQSKLPRKRPASRVFTTALAQKFRRHNIQWRSKRCRRDLGNSSRISHQAHRQRQSCRHYTCTSWGR